MVTSLLFVSAYFTSIISGLTGLAGGVLLLGILTLVYVPQVALAFHSYSAFVSNLTRIGFFFKTIYFPAVWRYALLLLPGTALGAQFFQFVPVGVTEIVIGVMILIGVFGWPILFKQQKFGINGFIFIGFISGILGMLGGAVGPMLNPFFNRIHLNREQTISTKSACQLILHASRISTFSFVLHFDYQLFGWELVLVTIGSVAGIFTATQVAKRFTEESLNKWINGMLVLIALTNISRGIYRLL